MSITLQSTVGGFSAEFMRRLPLLEQAMMAHGLEPSQFVISKDSKATRRTELNKRLLISVRTHDRVGPRNSPGSRMNGA